MPDGEEYLLIAVDNGLCLYTGLKDGTLDLADIARMNDYLLMKRDNEEIARERAEAEAQRQSRRHG